MIRFVDLGQQIDGDGPRHFAFFNTVTDQFMTFDGEEVFETVEEFKLAASGSYQLDRYLGLIPKDWGKA